jgi:hypothetical protein
MGHRKMVSLKKVIDIKYVGVCRYTGYRAKSVMLKLECGHEQRRKASQGIPKRVRCLVCSIKDVTALGLNTRVEK